MAKVALIYFDVKIGEFLPSYSHGVGYLVGALKESGHKVSLYHLITAESFPETISSLDQDRPDIIGLSFTTNQRQYVRHFLTGFKTQSRKPLFLAGGMDATMLKEEMFSELPEIDGLCIGEGEGPLRELCRRLDAKEDFLSVPSFYFRTNDGVVKNPVMPLEDINRLPFADYSLFDWRRITQTSGGWFRMMLNRGCPYSCSYCCNHILKKIYPNNQHYVRLMEVDRAMALIKHNLSLSSDIKKVFLDDDTFTVNKKWLIHFCESYKKEINLPFVCQARVETVDEEMAGALKLAGCSFVNIGVESGNEWMRRYVLKRIHSNEKIREAFRIFRCHGIRTFAFSMVGLPFETARMVEDTFTLCRELRPDSGTCAYFYPYPGSEIHKLCVDYNLMAEDLGSRTSYAERSSIKEIFMTQGEVKNAFEKMKVLFYGRLFLSKVKMPLFLENIFLSILLLFRKFLVAMINPSLDNHVLMFIRGVIRKFGWKYFR